MNVRTVHERLLRALTGLGPGGLAYLVARCQQRGLKNKVTYTNDDGKTIVIPLMAQPSIVRIEQLGQIARVVDVFERAFVKTVEWWFQSPELQAIMPLEPEELDWISLAPPLRDVEGARWDMAVDPLGEGPVVPRLFEMNGCAVGGIHYSSAVMPIMIDAIEPLFDGYKLVETQRMDDLWRALILDVSGEGKLVWLEDRAWTLGTMEGPSLTWHADVFHMGASVQDPRELHVRRNKITDSRGNVVSKIWRNMELRDIVRVETESARVLKGLREAVKRGMVLGPLQQDLDHKSLLEVWSTRAWVKKFTPPIREVLPKHVPWTRLVTERRADGPDGEEVDLPEYALKRRTELVFKPNRGCGGEGVLIGMETKPAAWERAIARSTSGKEPGVVQRFVETARLPVPVVEGDAVKVRDFFMTYGVFHLRDRIGIDGTIGGIGILGRASPNRIVNVAQGGGLAAVLELRP